MSRGAAPEKPPFSHRGASGRRVKPAIVDILKAVRLEKTAGEKFATSGFSTILRLVNAPRSAARAEVARMKTTDAGAGRLEPRVRPVCRETRPGVLGFCSLPL